MPLGICNCTIRVRKKDEYTINALVILTMWFLINSSWFYYIECSFECATLLLFFYYLWLYLWSSLLYFVTTLWSPSMWSNLDIFLPLTDGLWRISAAETCQHLYLVTCYWFGCLKSHSTILIRYWLEKRWSETVGFLIYLVKTDGGMNGAKYREI